MNHWFYLCVNVWNALIFKCKSKLELCYREKDGANVCRWRWRRRCVMIVNYKNKDDTSFCTAKMCDFLSKYHDHAFCADFRRSQWTAAAKFLPVATKSDRYLGTFWGAAANDRRNVNYWTGVTRHDMVCLCDLRRVYVEGKVGSYWPHKEIPKTGSNWYIHLMERRTLAKIPIIWEIFRWSVFLVGAFYI